jgi:hypothetical protein
MKNLRFLRDIQRIKAWQSGSAALYFSCLEILFHRKLPLGKRSKSDHLKNYLIGASDKLGRFWQ